MRQIPVALLLAASIGASAAAHEFWIQPSMFRPAPGERVRLELRVGDGLPGEPQPRDPERLLSFVAHDPSGKRDVAGLDGQSPAGVLRPAQPGACVVAYHSRWSAIELPSAAFESYLEEDGLERIVALRAERGEQDAPGRERYCRCAKALLAVGGSSAPGFDRKVGLPIEIIPIGDPSALRERRLTVEVLFDGKPLPDVLVRAMHGAAAGEEADHVATGRTDEAGRVTLALPEPGFWLVAAVHMVEAPEDSGADWQSYWASLTFDAAYESAPRAD
jgi:uncharacterized GH25 family protein